MHLLLFYSLILLSNAFAAEPDVQIEIRGGEKFNCRYSHAVVASSVTSAYYCDAVPPVLLFVTQHTSAGYNYQSVEAFRTNQSSGAEFAPIVEAKQNGQTIFAVSPNCAGMAAPFCNPDTPFFDINSTLAGRRTEAATVLARLVALEPVGNQTPLAEFTTLQAELTGFALDVSRRLETLLASSEQTVTLANGQKFSCTRGTAVSASATFRRPCEAFLCQPKDAAPLARPAIFINPQGISGAGPGTGSTEFLLADANGLASQRSDIAAISVMDGGGEVQLQPNQISGDTRLQNNIPAQYSEALRVQGSSEQLYPFTVLNYRGWMQSLASTCQEPEFKSAIDQIIATADALKQTVDSQYDKQLIRIVNGVLVSTALRGTELPSNVCQLSGDTFVESDDFLRDSQAFLAARGSYTGGPLTEAQAQALMREILAMNDIPFAHVLSGCEARAQIIAERLRARGIPVQKIFAEGGALSPFKGSRVDEWGFHVAPAVPVQTANGVEWRVLDGSVATHPLSPRDWLTRFRDQTNEGPAIETVRGVEVPNRTNFWISPIESYAPEVVYPADKAHKIASETLVSNAEYLQSCPAEPDCFLSRELRFPRDQ